MPIKTFSALEYMTASNYNTYCQNNGLKWLGSTTASGSSSFLLLDVFTTEFDSYRIVIDSLRTSGASDSFNMRLRTSGGDYSGSTYYWAWNGVVWTTASAIGANSGGFNAAAVTQGVTSRSHSAVIELNNLRTSSKPTWQWQAIDTSNNCNRIGTGFVNNTADYIGIKLLSGTTTNFAAGSMHIYGYRKQ
jgi:hypothetical protein